MAFLNRHAIAFSVLLTVGLVIGKSFFVTNDFFYAIGSPAATVRTIITALLIFFLTTVASSLLMRLLSSRQSGSTVTSTTAERPISRLFFGTKPTTLLLLWAIILICWVPCLLAYWPGMFTYDITGLLQQGGDKGFSNMLPLLYTLFVKGLFGLVSAYGYEAGVILVSIVQMVLMSFLFANIVWRLNRMSIHLWPRIIALAWFALYPANPVFALEETKDTLFAGVFALVTLSLVQLARNPELSLRNWRVSALFGGGWLLLCLLRNNSMYALLLLVVLLAVFLRKVWNGYFRRLLVALGSSVIASFAIIQVLYPAIGVQPSPTREMLSVPAQQIALTYNLHGTELSQEQRDLVKTVIATDTKIAYNPRLADPVKDNTKNIVEDGLTIDFIRLWVSLGLRYPKPYLKAFITLNLQSWYPGTEFPDKYADKLYIETGIAEGYGVSRNSKAPAILNFYEGIATRADWQRIPVVSLLFDTALPFWFAVFGVMLSLYRRQKRDLLVFLLPLCLWVTIMLGPLTNGRYAYPFFVCYPLWLCVLLSRREERASEAPEEAGAVAS